MPRTLEITLLFLQSFHVAFLLLHDWISLGHLNDIAAVRRANSTQALLAGTLLSSAPFLFGLAACLRDYGHPYPQWLHIWLWASYGLLFFGELRAWWIPYLFHADPALVVRYKSMFGRTHSFLPVRNGIVPNTLHVTLHLATLATLLLLSQLP